MPPSSIQQACKAIASAHSIVCLTGAGVSAESGVPTFRDAQTGLWRHYDPEKLASPDGFARDPGLVWRWYMGRLSLLEGAKPNAGHLALAELERKSAKFTLVTQNVDDLHEQAGSQHVLHLHGRLNRFHCNQCLRPHLLTPEDQGAEQPPACQSCSALVRPSVVWFGETLPAHTLEAAIEAAQDCELMLVAGTSGLVYPAAEVPSIAKRAGAVVIDINLQPGPISRFADLYLAGPSGEILPQLLATY
jgi:NAD-dependent deacetylase